jgi:peptidyl-prolyl cis-trans isomerase SurA
VPGPASAPARASPSPATSASASPRRDSQVVRTSTSDSSGDATDRRRLPLEPGCPIARVGDEIITYHDLVLATRERLPRNLVSPGQEFDSHQQMELINHINRIKIDTLESLIERSMLFQEAKHHIKDPKVLSRINEDADKFWHDNEIVPLEREYNVDTEQQLKERLARQGRSLDAMHQTFRQLHLSRGYLHEKLKDKINVELPDLLKYYDEHVNKHEFDRSAQITWRELTVEIAKHPSRETARKKAEELLQRLQQGADFATLARAESDGPTSSRNRGGLMETSPGGYAVREVNQAIESLPLGRCSGVIEGPESFHIVKVERRRAAGPASFEEVQDLIKPIVQNQKFQRESAAYISKLRRRTPITIYSPTKSKKSPAPPPRASRNDEPAGSR